MTLYFDCGVQDLSWKYAVLILFQDKSWTPFLAYCCGSVFMFFDLKTLYKPFKYTSRNSSIFSIFDFYRN
jgi:uncharacterized membrane protein (DUF2068 family)